MVEFKTPLEMRAAMQYFSFHMQRGCLHKCLRSKQALSAVMPSKDQTEGGMM